MTEEQKETIRKIIEKDHRFHLDEETGKYVYKIAYDGKGKRLPDCDLNEILASPGPEEQAFDAYIENKYASVTERVVSKYTCIALKELKIPLASEEAEEAGTIVRDMIEFRYPTLDYLFATYSVSLWDILVMASRLKKKYENAR